jgi:PKD repeat protein
VAYEWDFGDGTTVSGPGVVHTFGAAGNVLIRLTVTDDGGLSSTGTLAVEIVEASGASS